MTTQTPAPGLDLSWVDPDVRPQDDFFAHVNGRWLDEHEIPADRSRDGAFLVLRDLSEERVRRIVEEQPAGTRIGDLFASFMDAERLERLGAAPLDDDLGPILEAGDPDELAAVLGRLERSGVPGLIRSYVNNDARDTTRYIVWFTQGGLGLPDESYYREEAHAGTLAAYRDHVGRMLELASVPDRMGVDAASAADRIVAVETRIATHHWDVVAFRDAERSYNLRALDDLDREAPGFPWTPWIEAAGGSRDSFAEIVVRQPDFIAAAAALWRELPLDDWRLWTAWRVVDARAPYLSRAFVDADFDFRGRVLTGTPELRDRWKRGVAVVEMFLGEEVGREYVARHFPPRNRERMDELVGHLLAAYRVRITDLEWMTPDTRARALEKLEKFTPKIGYPDSWRDYSGFRVDAGDLLGNIRRGYAHEQAYELAKLGGPVDRGEWHMTPQTVNAYYNPVLNEIVFPAAILQPPFFDADADDAVNYGAIGAVIGHEIGHGFDDQGSKYDGDGNLHDWWTAADRAAFEERTAALISQYDAFTPRGLDPSRYRVNGAFTVGENIGDLGGLGIALAAYELANAGAEPPVIDGTSGVHRVLWSWATVWRTKVRDEEAIRLLAIDPHSPAEFRCNGVVRNLDAFHEEFGVREGDDLWLAPERRVRIW